MSSKQVKKGVINNRLIICEGSRNDNDHCLADIDGFVHKDIEM